MSLIPAVGDGHLRVTTGQRDNAVAILREAAADGRLNFDELDNRVGTALRASIRDDLAAVMFDLVPTAQMDLALQTAAPLGDGPGYRWEEPLLINGEWSRNTVRQGAWEVPPFLEVNTGMGYVKLDMTHATCRSRVVDLVITSSSGTITLVVPHGWCVDTSEVQTSGMSGTISSRVPTRSPGDAPRIVVRGRTAGTLKVRPSTPRDIARQH